MVSSSKGVKAWQIHSLFSAYSSIAFQLTGLFYLVGMLRPDMVLE